MRNIIFLFSILLIVSCKKDNTPPDLQLKSGTGYTYADLTISPGGTFTVGVIADKRADDLHLIYTEVAYDGANTSNLIAKYPVVANQRNHSEQDILITCRVQAGTERWVFNVNDKNGRISKKEIKVTVQ